ncbi:C40 family peptidase [Rhodoflexus caldus]|uniref:C40 family peptidase n=1 Tax=Rhodoflexus caldus TaxID=2891236 RepID=UPI00202A827F|nr:C40 family peptidase [Rhodoflexus caldus]
MNIPGITFLKDSKGNLWGAQIDIAMHQQQFERFFDRLIAARNTQGIQFLKDSKGNVTICQVDLRIHQQVFDDFFNALIEANQPIKPQPPVATPANSQRSEMINRMLAHARTLIGTPYRSGGTTRETGLDCSGFTQLVFQEANMPVKLGRSSRDQILQGTSVSVDQLQPGDLVFFATTDHDPNRISHVGIVTKGGTQQEAMFIHASTSRGVIEQPIFTDYFRPRYRGARRVV